MEIPETIPARLEYCKKCRNSEELASTLKKTPKDLVDFLEYAIVDRTWCDQHSDFVKEILRWMTEQSFEGNLRALGRRLTDVLQNNYPFLSDAIPRNIKFHLRGGELEANSLLLISNNKFFETLLDEECKKKKKDFLSFPEIPYSLFKCVLEFIHSGIVADIWKRDQDELIQIIDLADLWNLPKLKMLCENALQKYITDLNVFNFLIRSYSQGWEVVKQYAINFINQTYQGFRIHSASSHHFAFEFQHFGDHALEAFYQLCNIISELSFSGSLPESKDFTEVLKNCKNLDSIDLSGTQFFSNRFLDVPSQITTLKLSQCTWLNSTSLKKFSEICPQVLNLNLSSNDHLNYNSFSELINFSHLSSLDLSRCRQISNEELTLVVSACPSLQELSLGGCLGIQEKGFLEISKKLHKLMSLNVSRCQILDGSLVEIGLKCTFLTTLDIGRCENISDNGILKLIMNAKNLKELIISSRSVSFEILDLIQQRKITVH